MSKANITEIDAFVRDEVMEKVESQIVMNNAILARLEGKGKYLADSGENIRTGARYAHLPGGFYARGAKFSATQKETVKEFIHDWKIKKSVFLKSSLINGGTLRWQPSASKDKTCAAAETEREDPSCLGSDSPICVRNESAELDRNGLTSLNREVTNWAYVDKPNMSTLNSTKCWKPLKLAIPASGDNLQDWAISR